MMILAGCGGGGGSSQKPIQNRHGGAPTLEFSANSTSVVAGQTVTLSWSTTKATSLTISPEISDETSSLVLNGSATVVIDATTTYTATAIGSGGTTKAQVTITASSADPTVTLSVSPNSI